MFSNRGRSEAVARLRELTGRGLLADWMATAAPADRAGVYQALYQVAWPIVFDMTTRGMELRRGHTDCARGLPCLKAECLDRFHDDVVAVVDGAIRRGTTKVQSLEAWIVTITNSATVDGHRRRRGERGALQRPRVPKWLASELAGDQWLLDLAVRILVWVGLPGTAGTDLWPWDSWAEQRVTMTRDWTHSTPETVRDEVDHVLDRMRTRPEWFAAHVERPLSRKQVPTAGQPDDTPLALVGQHEIDDARLMALARVAIRVIKTRLRHGQDPRSVVPSVLRLVFCGDQAGTWFDRAPHDAPWEDEWLADRLANEMTAGRITVAVMDIVTEGARDLHQRAG
ncbi:hypothetical protein [Actinocrispum wychmicini]|uniref:Uncharacterized protein n=1 Tax=Actinocrispum wychmicini TaxID=1213861 RepID=A0A4R2JS98_9PSEU|nr:hypothetical protein [Actinocrispum wychmicini]TCO59749.1 hypothetical protein EV192_104592 [Actinocrispum wychmicini]